MPFRLTKFDDGSVDKINQNEETLFKTKLESRWRRTASGTTSYIYQVMETGMVTTSANGSATIVSNQGFHDKHGTILYAQAHSNHPYINVAVTDVTSTGLTLTFATIGTTADASAALISSIVTASWSAWFMVIATDA